VIDTNHQLLGEVESILKSAGIADAAEEASWMIESAARLADKAGYASQILEMASQRAKGTPLAYLTGCTVFMGVRVLTAPGALIPRDETELLGRTAVDVLDQVPSTKEQRLIDMCCGSGNLACAIAYHKVDLQVWAADLTDGTVAVARANVEALGIANRVTVLQGDLFAPLSGVGVQGTIDVVVCNPPYISTGKLAKERGDLLSHEPREAFDGGPYGVSIFQRVVRDAVEFLRPGGNLLFEIGLGQERQVSMLFDRTRSYEPVSIVNDAAGHPRVLIGRKALQ
jgi:release factor glutamine methyltransferase